MADHFVTAVVNRCVSGGVGELYATSGVSLQDGMRRETGAPVVVVFTQSGGTSEAQDQVEALGVQALVDAEVVTDARDTARQIYDLLHETVNTVLGSFKVLWLRGVAPPQDVGPGPGADNRFVVSVNFDALIKR